MVDIKSAFSGASVAITGSTGFLGTALVSKILTSIPDVGEILLLVRSKPGAPASDRVRRRVLGNNALAHVDKSLHDKVRAIDSDLRLDGLGLSSADLQALGGADYVIHSAAAVSFDAAVDEAFETNLMGSLRLLDIVKNPRRHIHVSTAYVSGLAKGTVDEVEWTTFPSRPKVDWKAELDSSKETRRNVESDSRLPERLAKFTKQAFRALGPAGAPSVGSAAEQLRREWVTDRMVNLGRARAQALGWPDAYAFTKALTESAILSRQYNFPISIVRPSIIESSLREPFPGWIRGFRMAEPIFLMYGRGTLSEFPGLPDAVVDVVPVDLVVNAILATAAADEGPRFVHVGTGNRKPMRYRELVAWTHDYFQEHPYLDEDGQPILPKMWTFPGKRSVATRLKWGRRALKVASRLADRLPAGTLTNATDRIDMRRDEVEQAVKYAELYGAYAEVETIFNDRNAQVLHESLTDPATFGFDPTDIDWKSYLLDYHLPQITSRRGTIRRRPRPAQRSVVTPGGPEVLAVFDLEGTVLDSNVVDMYLWLRLAASPKHEWPHHIAALAAGVPKILAQEKRDRGEFLRHFYRRYEGAPVAELSKLAADAFNSFMLPRAFPAGLRRIREHRAAGHRVVFITGALDFTISPLAPLADFVAAARLGIEGGRYTADLTEVPFAGDARAVYLRRLAKELDANLKTSYAYGDAISDLPMLECVGNPVAVAPDHRLARIARDRRWPVEHWTCERNAPRFTMPGFTEAARHLLLKRGAS